MNYLHIGENICGIPQSLAKAQQRVYGYQLAHTLSFVPDPQGHRADFQYIVTEDTHPIVVSRVLRRADLIWMYGCINYNVFQFAGNSIANGIDILVWKLLGKKVTIHYHGSEIRNKQPLFFHRFADALFVSTPDLLEFAPTATWLPNPIFIEDYREHHTIGTIIAHAPTNREIKGTQYIIDAFKGVQKSIPTAILDLVEGVSYGEALERYRRSSIVVDQLKIGWYGMVALECMAMGVPVMCYIRDDLKKYLGDTPPLYFTTPETLEEDIITVLKDTRLQSELSRRGKEYVSTNHNPTNIAAIIEGAIT
jgi:glycosyltransferase involved in cell wall biosynthesis